MATRVGMCCSQQVQVMLQRWDNHAWAGKSGRDQTTQFDSVTSLPHSSTLLFPHPKRKTKSSFDHWSHWDEVFISVVVVASAFCEHMNCPECRNLKCQTCVIWDCVYFSCIWYELHGLWVCACGCPCVYVCLCSCSSADHNLSPRVLCCLSGVRGRVGLRNTPSR